MYYNIWGKVTIFILLQYEIIFVWANFNYSCQYINNDKMNFNKNMFILITQFVNYFIRGSMINDRQF